MSKKARINRIGIVGGGQLGQMITMSAKEMGFEVGILEPTQDCPASQVSDWQIQAEYDDKEALQTLAEKVDVITYEFENVDANALAYISEKVSIPQGTYLLRMTQNREQEKKFLHDLGIPIADFYFVRDEQDLAKGVQLLDYPCVLKTCFGGYDGKGQVVLKNENNLSESYELIKKGNCVLEKWLPFEKEISVLVCGNGQEDYVTFPVGENKHHHNILHETIVPARIEEATMQKAQELAKIIAQELTLSGLLAVEMFVMSDGTLYVNELAPRPHNSGHYSIEACDFSQFDLHIRGILGFSLPTPKLLVPAVMVNVLGQHLAEAENLMSDKKNWHFHFYGKKEAKLNRKMGHITILDSQLSNILEEIKETTIWHKEEGE